MSGVLGPGPGAAARMRQAAADLHARTGRTACNGSLMRTSPVARARLGDPDAIAQAATAVSALTAVAACAIASGSPRRARATGEVRISEPLHAVRPVRACRSAAACRILAAAPGPGPRTPDMAS